MPKISRNIKNKLLQAGPFFVVAACFVLPFSTALTSITTVLALFCWIFSGQIASLPRLMFTNHLVFLSLCLLMLLAAGLFYTPAPPIEALDNFKKYRELLIFPMVISFVAYKSSISKMAENGFFLGCVVLMLVSYGIYYSIIPSNRYGYSLVYHITHSYFMAVLAFWCLQRMFDSSKYLVLWLILFTCTTVNLFYITPGRTGMLGYIILVLLTCYQRLPLKKSIPATLVVALLISIAFFTSQNFSTRVLDAVNEIKTYQSTSSRTSLGQRFDWWNNSFELIKQEPYWGHGTGSFKTKQNEIIQDTQTKPTDNPHNEYLLISVQTGLVGLFIFISFLAAIFIHSFKLPPPRKYLLQGVVVSMACGSLMNSLLFDSLPGHYFAMLSAVLCAPQNDEEPDEDVDKETVTQQGYVR